MLLTNSHLTWLAGSCLLVLAGAESGLATSPPQTIQVPRACQAVDAAGLKAAADRAQRELELSEDLVFLPDGDEVRVHLPPDTERMVYCIGFVEDGAVTGVLAAGPGVGQEAGTTAITFRVPDISFGFPRERQLVLLGFVPTTAEDRSVLDMTQAPDSVAADITLASEDRPAGEVEAWSPSLVLSRTVTVSNRPFALAGAIAGVGIFYLLAGLTLRRDAHRAAFNPVYLTSGQFGRASLSQFQIFAFTLLVVGLLIYIILRTGALSDISTDVLLLLGISAGGAGGSKLAAVAKKRLSIENWTWLRERGWLTAFEKGTDQKADPKKARWGDLLKSGENDFDIYKFQLVTVSAVVALALLTSDQTQLATFTIPPNLLALLGLSNVVYIGAKAVTPNSMEKLNAKVDAAREAENAMLTGTPISGPAGKKVTDPRSHYLAVAREAAEILRQVYGSQGTKFGKDPITEEQLLTRWTG